MNKWIRKNIGCELKNMKQLNKLTEESFYYNHIEKWWRKDILYGDQKFDVKMKFIAGLFNRHHDIYNNKKDIWFNTIEKYTWENDKGFRFYKYLNQNGGIINIISDIKDYKTISSKRSALKILKDAGIDSYIRVLSRLISIDKMKQDKNKILLKWTNYLYQFTNNIEKTILNIFKLNDIYKLMYDHEYEKLINNTIDKFLNKIIKKNINQIDKIYVPYLMENNELIMKIRNENLDMKSKLDEISKNYKINIKLFNDINIRYIHKNQKILKIYKENLHKLKIYPRYYFVYFEYFNDEFYIWWPIIKSYYEGEHIPYTHNIFKYCNKYFKIWWSELKESLTPSHPNILELLKKYCSDNINIWKDDVDVHESCDIMKSTEYSDHMNMMLESNNKILDRLDKIIFLLENIL